MALITSFLWQIQKSLWWNDSVRLALTQIHTRKALHFVLYLSHWRFYSGTDSHTFNLNDISKLTFFFHPHPIQKMRIDKKGYWIINFWTNVVVVFFWNVIYSNGLGTKVYVGYINRCSSTMIIVPLRFQKFDLYYDGRSRIIFGVC